MATGMVAMTRLKQSRCCERGAWQRRSPAQENVKCVDSREEATALQVCEARQKPDRGPMSQVDDMITRERATVTATGCRSQPAGDY